MSSSSSLAALSSATLASGVAAGPSASTAARARLRWGPAGAPRHRRTPAPPAGSLAHDGALPGADGALAHPSLDSGVCRAAAERPGSPPETVGPCVPACRRRGLGLGRWTGARAAWVLASSGLRGGTVLRSRHTLDARVHTEHVDERLPDQLRVRALPEAHQQRRRRDADLEPLAVVALDVGMVGTRVQVTRLLRDSQLSTSGQARRMAAVSMPPTGAGTSAGGEDGEGAAGRVPAAGEVGELGSDAAGAEAVGAPAEAAAATGAPVTGASASAAGASGAAGAVGAAEGAEAAEAVAAGISLATGSCGGEGRSGALLRSPPPRAGAGAACGGRPAPPVGTPPTSRRRSMRSSRAAYPLSPEAPGSSTRAQISSSCSRGRRGAGHLGEPGVDDVGRTGQRARHRTPRPAGASARAGPRAVRAAPTTRRRARRRPR